MNRRVFSGLMLLAVVWMQSACADDAASVSTADSPPLLVMHRDPSCGCCGDWAEHMQANGFEVEVRETNAINAVRKELGVPAQLASCHTAEVGGYLVEGHVPADAVQALLEQQPEIAGISVPGMPVGSPGMEMGERVDEYPVVAFDAEGRMTLFARYRGHERLE